jgi:hypothetical protein
MTASRELFPAPDRIGSEVFRLAPRLQMAQRSQFSVTPTRPAA